jgi:hypothetical protein
VTANPAAFASLVNNQAAMSALTRNSAAFAALSRDANFRQLAASPAFSAALQSGNFAKAMSSD